MGTRENSIQFIDSLHNQLFTIKIKRHFFDSKTRNLSTSRLGYLLFKKEKIKASRG